MTPRHVIWLGLALRLSVAVWNSFFGPSPGADGDAADFHVVAAEFARTLDFGKAYFGLLYAYLLGAVYHVTFISLFWGCLLSCFAWYRSARLLRKIMTLLQLTRQQQVRAMLVYSLWPTAVLWTAVTLREAYQLWMVNLAMYSAFRIYQHKSTRHWAVLIWASFVGGMLQPGVFGFGVFIIIATLVWLLLRKRRSIPWLKVAWITPFAIAVLVYSYSLFTSVYSFEVGKGLATAVESYQKGGLTIAARTVYKSDVSIDGWTGLLAFLPESLFQYLFEPMPWRSLARGDLVPVAENLLRAFLLLKAFAALRRLDRIPKRRVLLLMSGYLVLETVFSLGTINWGTAARHHIPAMGLLVAAAYSKPRRVRRRVMVPEAPPSRLVTAPA